MGWAQVEVGERQAVHCVEAGGITSGPALDKETAVSMIGICGGYNETLTSVAMRRDLTGPSSTSPVATEMGVSSFKSRIYERSGRKGSP